jgi:hypothetical protein
VSGLAFAPLLPRQPALPSLSYRTHELEHALNLVECKGILVTPQYRTDNYEVRTSQAHDMILFRCANMTSGHFSRAGCAEAAKEYRTRTCPLRFVQGRNGKIFWLRQPESKRLQCWRPYRLHLIPHSLYGQLKSKPLILFRRPSWTSFFQSSTTRGRGSRCMPAMPRRLGTSSQGPRPHTRHSSTLRYRYAQITTRGKKWTTLRGTFLSPKAGICRPRFPACGASVHFVWKRIAL